MISLTKNIPVPNIPSAEWIRLYNIYENYREEALFWCQEEKAYISMLDGDMTIYNIDADICELKHFIDVISPKSIFSDYKTISELGYRPTQKLCVLAREGAEKGNENGDEFNSKSVYDLFEKAGLDLPQYEFFAPDFCKRINRKNAGCYFEKDISAAFYIIGGSFALIQGIASLKKGGGTRALNAVLSQNYDKTVVVCCKSELCNFYIKNGFERLYDAAFKEREQ